MISSLCSFLSADSESAKIINKTNFSYLLQAVSVFYLQKHLHATAFKVLYFPYWWQKNNKKSKKYCEQFSKFFTEISTSIQSKISPTRKSYTDYLLNQKQWNISQHTHYWWRISNTISDLNIRKSTGPNSITAKVMKQIGVVISATLAKLINRSFQNGVFTNILKIPKVILIFKNYRPISLLSNIGKIINA